MCTKYSLCHLPKNCLFISNYVRECWVKGQETSTKNVSDFGNDRNYKKEKGKEAKANCPMNLQVIRTDIHCKATWALLCTPKNKKRNLQY